MNVNVYRQVLIIKIVTEEKEGVKMSIEEQNNGNGTSHEDKVKSGQNEFPKSEKVRIGNMPKEQGKSDASKDDREPVSNGMVEILDNGMLKTRNSIDENKDQEGAQETGETVEDQNLGDAQEPIDENKDQEEAQETGETVEDQNPGDAQEPIDENKDQEEAQETGETVEDQNPGDSQEPIDENKDQEGAQETGETVEGENPGDSQELIDENKVQEESQETDNTSEAYTLKLRNIESKISELKDLQNKIVENTSKLESLDQKISSVEAMKDQLMSQVKSMLRIEMSKIDGLFEEHIKNNSKLALIENIDAVLKKQENINNKQLDELKSENGILKVEKENNQFQIKNLTEKNNALEKTKSEHIIIINNQREKLEELETKKEECIELTNLLSVANKNLENLQNEKGRMEEMFRELIEAIKNRLNGNKNTFDNFNGKYADLLAKIENIQEELSKLVEKFEAKDTELEDSQNNFSHEKEVNKALKEEFEVKKNELENTLQSEITKLNTEKEEMKNIANAKVNKLQDALQEKEIKIKDMEMALEGASLKIKTLSKERETLDSKVEAANRVVSECEEYRSLFSPFEGIYNSTISLPGLMEKFGITSERTKNDYLNLASLVISNMIAQKIFDYYSVDKKGEGLDEAAKALIAEVNKYYDKEILYVPIVGESFERENMRDIEKPRDPFKTFEEVYCPGIRQDGKTIQKAIVKGKR